MSVPPRMSVSRIAPTPQPGGRSMPELRPSRKDRVERPPYNAANQAHTPYDAQVPFNDLGRRRLFVLSMTGKRVRPFRFTATPAGRPVSVDRCVFWETMAGGAQMEVGLWQTGCLNPKTRLDRVGATGTRIVPEATRVVGLPEMSRESCLMGWFEGGLIDLFG